MCISLTNATACKYDIQIDTVRTQSAVITELRLYPAEGPMPRASEAPFIVMDHSQRRKVFAVQSHEQSLERRRVPRSITRKKTGSVSDHQEEDVGRAVAESLPKNLIAAHPVQGSQADEGSGGTCSTATPCAQRYGTGKAKGRLRCHLSEAKGKNWTDRGLQIYGCGGEGERKRRNPGDGDTKRR